MLILLSLLLKVNEMLLPLDFMGYIYEVKNEWGDTIGKLNIVLIKYL